MRILIGFLIIVAGLGMLLESMEVVTDSSVWEYIWPVFLIGVGLISWKTNPRIRFGPIIIILLGVLFLLDNLDVLAGNAWNYVWPVIIVLIGLRILIGKRAGGHVTQDGAKPSFAAFSGVEGQVSGPFSGTSTSAVFGGTKLDLRQADIQDGAVIDVFAAFGGIEIVVPRNVHVKTDVLPLFGGASNKSQPDGNPTKTLHVNGTALFGGVDVKN